jgi:hypothetical protein
MTLPERANYSLTESALSPFPAEPAHQNILLAHRETLQRDWIVPDNQVGDFRLQRIP